MRKKDYILIAALLSRWIHKYANGDYYVSRAHSGDPEAKNILEAFAYRLKKEDPQFDVEEFLKMCE